MSRPLKDKTNRKIIKEGDFKKKGDMDDRDKVIAYIENILKDSNDPNLKYDLMQCQTILEGKENQVFSDTKEEFIKLLRENDKLMDTNRELTFKIDCLEDELDKFNCSKDLTENYESNDSDFNIKRSLSSKEKEFNDSESYN
ncbi:hypothetical protein A0H76_2081 [Hepatospora eriocheir]|uniref:Uncharacterized protein n=1 Tax=Hepatospora eriocheir TaxID=1081669 RepID=A0A1X0QK61_9MICR|nr:hypothetical protein A0H76_2081 [Hepatospora eriocheir]